MRKTGLRLVLFGLLVLLSLHTTSAFAQATRTWVSGVGDDVNPCSRTAPCKTFAGAISKTAAGGEIDCLDPGGFGTLTITKAMTIDCGPYAGGVLNSGTNGIVVNAGATDKVVLRNVVIQGTTAAGLQGTNGIRWLGGQELDLYSVVVQGQSVLGLDVAKTAAGNLTVRDSVFTEVPEAIKLATSAGNLVASIDHVRIDNLSGNGIEAASANVFANVSNSVITLPAASGTGILAGVSGSFINVETTVFSNNAIGASVVSGATLRLSNNWFWDCGTAINAAGGASFLSAGDNKVGGGSPGSAQTASIVVK
jgi:hypothetical protein